jgi:hypothetical protein
VVANRRRMRNRSLHEALRAFTEQAALTLDAQKHAGAEVPFEVVESPGARTALYCYRPLTSAFIGERADTLEQLPGHLPAVGALEGLGGLDDYLAARGEARVPEDPGDRADATLRAFLNSVYDEASDFAFDRTRFGRAYRELESVVYEGRTISTLVVPVQGLELDSAEVVLAEGFALARGDTLPEVPPEAVWEGSGDGLPNVLAVVAVEDPGIDAAVERLRRLQTALRLFETGAVGLGPAGWARMDAGPWRVVPVGRGASPRGLPTAVMADQEDELRGFCNLVAKRAPRGGEVAWALARFEMGVERPDPLEAVTDWLHALRVLLEPEGPASGRLAQRLSAICALPDDRATLAERIAHAISLEHAVTAGIAPAGPGAEELCDELGDHLRALLRDVICGHLDADLVTVAEGLLGEAITDDQPALAAEPVV